MRVVILVLLASLSGCHPVLANMDKGDCTKSALAELQEGHKQIAAGKGGNKGGDLGKKIAKDAFDRYIEEKWLNCKIQENQNDQSREPRQAH